MPNLSVSQSPEAAPRSRKQSLFSTPKQFNRKPSNQALSNVAVAVASPGTATANQIPYSQAFATNHSSAAPPGYRSHLSPVPHVAASPASPSDSRSTPRAVKHSHMLGNAIGLGVVGVTGELHASKPSLRTGISNVTGQSESRPSLQGQRWESSWTSSSMPLSTSASSPLMTEPLSPRTSVLGGGSGSRGSPRKISKELHSDIDTWDRSREVSSAFITN